jgi:hypothetical protein
LDSCRDFWGPIRGRLTVINGDRYSHYFKVHAKLAKAILEVISIGFPTDLMCSRVRTAQKSTSLRV